MEISYIYLGQAIPPGLHVRMNLETGQTEAKLLDSNDQSKSQNSVIASDNKADVYSVPKSSESKYSSNFKTIHFLL